MTQTPNDALPDDQEPNPTCQCLRCVTQRDEGRVELFGMVLPVEATRMFVCQVCGNKRCPHSDDHRNPCSGSNEPGQPGSRYA